MEQNLWLAVHRFSFWYWKLGGTVKRTTLYNWNCFPDNFQMWHFDCLFLLCLHLQSLELCGSPSGFSGELSNVPPLCRVAGQSLKASNEESCIVSGRALGTDHCQVLYLSWWKIKSLLLPRQGTSSQYQRSNMDLAFLYGSSNSTQIYKVFFWLVGPKNG